MITSDTHRTSEFKKLLIGLDLTDTDDVLIRYTARLCKILNPEKIYFTHITHRFDIFHRERQEVWRTDEPLDEFMEHLLWKKVKQHFADHERYLIQCFAAEGQPYEQMLRWAGIKDADLIVVGRKLSLKGSGMVPQKLALTAPCSLLLVPEDCDQCYLENIVVGCDFSEHSAIALAAAVELASCLPFSSVYCQHVFDVPFMISDSRSHYEALVEKKRLIAARNYDQFIHTVDTRDVKVIPVFTPRNQEDASTLVCRTAGTIEAGLIIAGGKGRTFMANLVSESFTRKLIEQNCDIPMLIRKKKNNNFTVIDVLKK